MFFIDLRERRGEREREGERNIEVRKKDRLVASCPNQGSNPQPEHAP